METNRNEVQGRTKRLIQQSRVNRIQWKFGVLTAAMALLGSATIARADANPKVVPTMAALRALDVSNGTVFTNDTVALLVDYYAPSDVTHLYGYETHGRGGGFFRWRKGDTHADDGGRFIPPTTYGTNTGRWERMLNGAVANVKMWGAKGDGKTNGVEWAAIQNAVNACQFPWADELLIPTGTYVVTNTIIFPSQLHIRGEGRGNNTMVVMPQGISKDIFRTHNADNAMQGGLYSSGGVTYNGQNAPVDWDHGMVFEDLFIGFDDPNQTITSTNAALVVCNPGEANTIRNIFTANGGYGIRCLGVGAPGLRVLNCSTFYPTIAGISIEGLTLTNGNPVFNAGGPVSLTGVGGDSFSSAKAPTATLIRITNCLAIVSINNLKAEGEFGGGVIQYSLPANWSAGNSMGSISIQGLTYNGTSSYGNPHDLIVLKGGNGAQRTASVSVHQLNLYGTRYLVRDEITGRNIEPDIQAGGGNQQTAARLPMHYEGYKLSGTNSWDKATRLVVGQTAYSYLYFPTNTGWYRIMVPLPVGLTRLAGKLVINSVFESTELQIDLTQYQSTPQITVTRCPQGSSTPLVTKARAFQYWENSLNGIWAGVDVYVGNPISPANAHSQYKRITFAHDIDGLETPGTGAIQLLDPIPVSATLPSGAVYTEVNTYR